MKKFIIFLISIHSVSLTSCLNKCNSGPKGDDQRVDSLEVQLENQEVEQVQQDQIRDVIEGDSLKLDSGKLR